MRTRRESVCRTIKETDGEIDGVATRRKSCSRDVVEESVMRAEEDMAAIGREGERGRGCAEDDMVMCRKKCVLLCEDEQGKEERYAQ